MPLDTTVTDITQSHDLGRLTDIFDQDCQLAIWTRPPQPEIERYFDTIRLPSCGLRLALASGECFPTTHLPEGPGQQALLADIDLLADIYGNLLGCPKLGIRIEVLEQAMCPRFHIDRVGIRLLCTYRGPGTEYLPEHAADRRWLGKADTPIDAVIQQANAITAIPPFALALLKGNGWQENQGRGIIHRSPHCQDKRILLAIDAIWE